MRGGGVEETEWYALEIHDLDDVAESIDRPLNAFRRGVVSENEAFTRICTIVSNYVAYSLATTEELAFIVDYARDTIRELSELPAVRDPLLIEIFEEYLQSAKLAEELEARLDALLDGLEAELAQGSLNARHELVELCRQGWRERELLLRFEGSTEHILQLAHDAGVAEALVAAVHPEGHRNGQLADPLNSPDEFVLAMNLLAHLAADPDHGLIARAGLIELTDYPETAGAAAIRIPIHLLTDDDRTRLLEVHESRAAMFGSDPFYVPVGPEQLRASRVVRSALWQAFDARFLA